MNLTEKTDNPDVSKIRRRGEGTQFAGRARATRGKPASVRIRHNDRVKTRVGTPNITVQRPDNESVTKQPVPLARIAEPVLTAMSSHRGFVGGASAACSAIADQLSAQRVSIGWHEKQRCDVIATSSGNPSTLSTVSQSAIREAMIEAINQQTTITSVNPNGVQRIAVSARALARQQAGGAGLVISTPLAIDNSVIGAVCIEFDIDHAARIVRSHQESVSLIESLVPGMARVLTLTHELERPWHQRARSRLSRAIHGAGMPHSSRRRIAMALALVAGAVGLLFPFHQSINSDARVEGEAQRIVAAPTEGYLQSVDVRPGDRVSANQILAKLGERELELKRDRLIGEVAQHQADASTAIAQGDRSAMAVSRSLADQAKAQLALIQGQLELATVRAPIDGIVIDGDLHQSIGAPVDRGQNLFTVAPADSWRVIVDLDEKDIAKLSDQQIGSLYLSALPWEQVKVVVRRIAPSATTSNGRNVFEVEASIPNPPKQIRPGLKGTVRMSAGRQSLIARMTRRIRETTGRLVWRWNPWQV